MEEYRRRGRFQGEVIGPIGAFLKIAPGKEQFAELASTALGNGTLDRFIVTNAHDRKVMGDLRKQLQCGFSECGLFQVKKDKRFDVDGPPAPDIETVASVLVISNDIVFNCLVDHANIEKRALATSKQISEDRLLISLDNGRYKIRGEMHEVYFLPRGDKWTVRQGAMSLSSNDRKMQRKIGVDRTQAIKESETELRQLEEELDQLKKAETAATKERVTLQKRWNEARREEKKTLDKIGSLTRKKEEIEQEMETTANTVMDTTDLEEDVAQAEEQVQVISEEEQAVSAEIEKLEPAFKAAADKVDEVKARNEKVLQDMNDAEEAQATWICGRIPEPNCRRSATN